jgi:hypothetical protein
MKNSVFPPQGIREMTTLALTNESILTCCHIRARPNRNFSRDPTPLFDSSTSQKIYVGFLISAAADGTPTP